MQITVWLASCVRAFLHWSYWKRKTKVKEETRFSNRQEKKEKKKAASVQILHYIFITFQSFMSVSIDLIIGQAKCTEFLLELELKER